MLIILHPEKHQLGVITVKLLIVNVAINRLTLYTVPPPIRILQNTKIAVVSFRPHHVLILQHHHNSIWSFLSILLPRILKNWSDGSELHPCGTLQFQTLIPHHPARGNHRRATEGWNCAVLWRHRAESQIYTTAIWSPWSQKSRVELHWDLADYSDIIGIFLP